MPRQKGTSKGPTKPITLRLDDDTETFYKRKANEHGISLAEYLRQTLVQGVIAENVQEIEERLRRVVAEINAAGAAGSTVQVPDDLLRRLCERGDVGRHCGGARRPGAV